MRLLIVEDNSYVADMLIRIVNETGHRVTGHGRSIEDSRILADECECDAAILDADLLSENMMVVAATLRSRKIPAIVLANLPATLPQIITATTIIAKPLRLPELRTALSLIETSAAKQPASAKLSGYEIAGKVAPSPYRSAR